jgi:hypothetical protein
MTRRILKCVVVLAVALACAGSKGDKGDKGDQGDPGPQGDFTGTFNGPATFNGENTFNGNATMNGRVGAGVTGADSRLHVAGTGTNAGTGSVSASAGTTALSGVGTSFTGEVTVGSIVATTGSCSGNGQARLVASVGDNATLDVSVPWTVNVINCTFNVTRPTAKVGMDAATTDFIVNGQGQVGIGTATPAAKLDVRGTVSSTNIGVFCGVTAAAYTGAQVGGYTGAKTKCEAACRHPNAHMCTTHEYVMSRQLGITAPNGGAWISGMYSLGSNAGDDDCDEWVGGATEYAGIWGFTSPGQDLNWVACTGSYKLACCL